MNNVNSNCIIPFIFENHEVRAIKDENGNPWWVAKDVCEVLLINDHQQAVEKLDADERGGYKVPTPGGEQTMVTVNEPGLYTLIIRSNKPEAKRFKRWITHEVIPAIRKTGAYSLPNANLKYVNLTPIVKNFTALKRAAIAAGHEERHALRYANNAIIKITGIDIMEMIHATHLLVEPDPCKERVEYYRSCILANNRPKPIRGDEETKAYFEDCIQTKTEPDFSNFDNRSLREIFSERE